MSAARPAPLRADRQDRGRFVLYVEGPRDRDILHAWARRMSPGLAWELARSAVILGGRRPERALTHFRELEHAATGSRGICVLDRDEGLEHPASERAAGLEFFTWSRRHIESYLLLPQVIRRALRRAGDHPRVSRALDTHLPEPGDETAWRELDAKRLLAAHGALARALGQPLPPGRLAREMFVGELHPDIRLLFERMRDALRALDVSA